MDNKFKCCSNNHKPWITSAILKSIKRKHRLYKKFLHDKSDHSKLKYKIYKNRLTKTIRLSEKIYILTGLNRPREILEEPGKLSNM